MGPTLYMLRFIFLFSVYTVSSIIIGTLEKICKKDCIKEMVTLYLGSPSIIQILSYIIVFNKGMDKLHYFILIQLLRQRDFV